jgi:hypothetical protein
MIGNLTTLNPLLLSQAAQAHHQRFCPSGLKQYEKPKFNVVH